MANHARLRPETEMEIDEAKKEMETHDGGEAEDDSYDSVEDAAGATKRAKKRHADKENGERAKKADDGIVEALKKKMKKDDDDEDDDDDDDEDEMEESFDFSEDLETLISEEATLSESFKEKAGVIFETAINSKVKTRVRQLEEEYKEKLEDGLEQISDELSEMLDSYLDYVVSEWMMENKLAVDQGLRTEIAEQFMSGLHKLFEESYVEVPESKVDIVNELAAENEKLEESYNSLREEIASLREKNEMFQKEAIINEVSEGLADTQADKLRSLVEDLDYDDDETYRKKVKMVRESYFTKKTPKYTLEESTEDDREEDREVAPEMQRYIETLRRSKK